MPAVKTTLQDGCVRASRTPTGQLFDQNRAYLGFGRRLNAKVDIEMGYLILWQGTLLVLGTALILSILGNSKPHDPLRRHDDGLYF